MTDPWNETSRQLARDASDAYDKANRERADRIPASAVRIANAAERQAAALEGLLALLTARLPAAAPAPADFDGAQYADAFDAKMGDPLAALGNLTVKPTAADPGDEDDRDADLDHLFGYTPKPAKRPWTHWAKLDPRSRELAKLATDAGKREEAAKTPATREAARADKNRYLTESKARQKRLRGWLDAGKGFIDGDALYYFDAAGTKVKFVPSPSPFFNLPGVFNSPF